MKRLRIGLVGAGAIAAAHVRAAIDDPTVKLSGICDTRIDAASALAQGCDAHAYGSLTAMIEEEMLDAAIIATPPNTHAAIATQLMNSGVHVLCEKPFATDATSARAMVRCAQKNGVLITMASKFRFVPAVREARMALDNGELGDVLLVENAFTSSLLMGGRWNSDPDVAGGGVIMDNGTHAVDIFRYLLGGLEDVLAIEHRRYQNLRVEDTAEIVMRTKHGAIARSDLSWSIDKKVPHFLRIFGTEGMREIGWNMYDKVAAFAAILENFASAIRGECPPEVSAADALASVMTIEAAYRALACRSWTSIAAVRRSRANHLATA